MNVDDKVNELRKRMKKYGLDAYIIPSSDPHISEYFADHWKSREWISGFTGSAGTFAATVNESGLWVDGRYFIQAEKQLQGSEIKLFRMGSPGVPTYAEWLEQALKHGQKVGYSGKLFPVTIYKDMESKFSPKGIVIDHRYDLTEEVWTADRPLIPSTSVFVHDLKYTGLSARQKIEAVREEMKKTGAGYYLLSSLDDIAWLFNIRAGDVPFVPVAIAYALISMTEAFLFIDAKKVPADVSEMLAANNVTIMEYEDIKTKISALDKDESIAFDPKRTNTWLYDSINPGCKKTEIVELTAKLKAVKNETELANFKKCHVKDGIAMVKFLMWLEQNIDKQKITEVDVSDKLIYFRSLQEDNMGPGFPTIAAYKDHGAMMHYQATEENHYVLENKGMMVLDCGGHYLTGTTDTSRTIVFDDVSEEEVHDFTMALKSHIALASAKFLHGATGTNLDILARMPLWEIGLDYKCGTGHGVGYFLSVHEGYHGFSMAPSGIKFEKGMDVTIEPGIYKEGKHGVRTENMYMVVEDEKTESSQFMRFKNMTYCPIDLRGVNPMLLTEKEKIWLNSYHAEVYEELSEYLNDGEKAWLKSNTRPVC